MVQYTFSTVYLDQLLYNQLNFGWRWLASRHLALNFFFPVWYQIKNSKPDSIFLLSKQLS
jgi:hypothetical protein